MTLTRRNEKDETKRCLCCGDLLPQSHVIPLSNASKAAVVTIKITKSTGHWLTEDRLDQFVRDLDSEINCRTNKKDGGTTVFDVKQMADGHYNSADTFRIYARMVLYQWQKVVSLDADVVDDILELFLEEMSDMDLTGMSGASLNRAKKDLEEALEIAKGSKYADRCGDFSAFTDVIEMCEGL